MSDLLKHFIAGAIIATIVMAAVLLILGTDKRATDWAVILSQAAAVIAGVSKELWDRYHGGPFDVADLTLTWAGAFVPLIIWGIVQSHLS
jgi:uncharacterized membrane protein YphA (DoxX/SURF4 family)